MSCSGAHVPRYYPVSSLADSRDIHGGRSEALSVLLVPEVQVKRPVRVILPSTANNIKHAFEEILSRCSGEDGVHPIRILIQIDDPGLITDASNGESTWTVSSVSP